MREDGQITGKKVLQNYKTSLKSEVVKLERGLPK